MNAINFVLVNPQLGENIGMSARAMLNFGFENLSIVNPRDGWPNTTAIKSSAHASQVIENAQIYSSLRESLSDSELIIATSARRRGMNLPFLKIVDLIEEIKTKYLDKRISFVFGQENSGLTNDHLSLSNFITTIPVSNKCPSINLSATVAVVAYELSKIHIPALSKKIASEVANRGDLEKFFSHLEIILDKNNYWKVPEKKKTMLRNLKNIFNRIPNLKKTELSSLMGVLNKLK
ncbi:MAG: RNA methyltransferase [Rickettsiales bacterium]